MTNCTHCGQTTATMQVEDVDGVYEIYSWNCSSCGQSVNMAMACVDPFELPDYCLVMESDGCTTPPAHVVAAKPARAAARRPAAAA